MIISDFSISFLLELLLEGLPISSSGHLQLLSYFYCGIQPLSFFYMHLSHVLIFFIQIFYVFPFLNILKFRKQWKLLFYIILNFSSITIITIIGYLVKNFIILKLFPNLFFPLPLGFFITMVFLLSIYFSNRSKSRIYYTLSFKESIFLGMLQCVALLSGVSRLATMIFGSQILHFKRRHSLFIAITSNAAISGMSLLYLLYYYCSEGIVIVFSQWLVIKLFVTLTFSAILFFLFIYLFNKNKILMLVLYELCIFLIAYYVY